MKTYRIGLLGLLLTLASPSLGSAPHTFTTADGRTLEATVKAYNCANKKIQIVREDGKKIWIHPSVFSQPGQDYIQRWIAADQFMSPAKFRIKGKKIKNKISKGKTEIVYEIILENKTGFPLSGLRIEYRAFILKKVLNKDGKDQEDSSRVDGGQLRIAEMPDGKKVSGKLKPIELSSSFKSVTEGNFQTGYDNYKLKTSEEELKGFWIKIYGPEIDGIPTIREWCNPSNTMKNFAWQEKSPSPSRSRSRRRQ